MNNYEALYQQPIDLPCRIEDSHVGFMLTRSRSNNSDSIDPNINFYLHITYKGVAHNRLCIKLGKGLCITPIGV